MPTELDARAHPKCTIAGEKETKAPGPLLLTVVNTFFVLPAHSLKFAAHKPQSQTSLCPRCPFKPCFRQLAGAPSRAGGHEATSLPCRSNAVGAGRWAL